MGSMLGKKKKKNSMVLSEGSTRKKVPQRQRRKGMSESIKIFLTLQRNKAKQHRLRSPVLLHYVTPNMNNVLTR